MLTKKEAKTSNRLHILEASLRKKEANFEASLAAHFEDVKSANGQPLNDKRNGATTMRRWEKQDNSLRAKKESIEKTKAAIMREKDAIARVEKAQFPDFMQELIDSEILTIWRKFPSFVFVNGAGKARIRHKEGKIFASHYQSLDKEQYALFRNVFNELNKKIKGDCT